MSISITSLPDLNGKIYLVGVYEDKQLSAEAKALDETSQGLISRALTSAKFSGKAKQTLPLYAVPGCDASQVILLGLGKAEDLTLRLAESLAGDAVAACLSAGPEDMVLHLPQTPNDLEADQFSAHLAFGASLRHYRFDKYKTTEKEDAKPSLKHITIVSETAESATQAFAPLHAVAEGVKLTRNLVSEPANVLFPESFAEICTSLSADGLTVEILDEAAMQELGMGALLGVGQGSVRQSQLVIMRWQGADNADDTPVAFVGKGVCFDTGGISIKPAGGMEDMKWDMGGAGVVTGVMKALAGRKAKVNAVGVIGLVENMPDGNAQRPGDIVTSMSGQTIEVINTDAEGRLVLADALWYTQDRFKPHTMIDLATLTGAILVALGDEYAGLFSNSDDLSQQLSAVGQDLNEKVWRFPLSDVYDKQIDCDAADMQNVGTGRMAGSITAAQFLQRFVNSVSWAHLDIAGVTFRKKGNSTTPKGGTGFGVRLLNDWVAQHCEK